MSDPQTTPDDVGTEIPFPVAGDAPQGIAGFVAYALYDLLGAVLSLAVLPLLPLTRLRIGLGERLGRLPDSARGIEPPLWLHAASVGEVLAAEPLLRRLREAHPDMAVVVSTTSLTGRATARERLPANAVFLLPADVRWAVARVLCRLRPRALVIVETEIWPALLRAAAGCAVPVALVSGCVSARSAARYARIRPLVRAALSRVGAFAMQTEADAARIVSLGANPQRVAVTGNLKFARGLPRLGTARGKALPDTGGRPVLVAASTHPGEEALVLGACAGLWAAHPDLLLVVAPRRPERFDEVEALLRGGAASHERRSRIGGEAPAVRAETRVLLLDSIGELLDLLPSARGVFVGGTIAPVGGHNVLEPALFSKPAAFGPETANVAEAAESLLAAGAAVRVHDAAELAAHWGRILAEPETASAMGAAAAAVLASQVEVIERTFAVVEGCLAREAGQGATSRRGGAPCAA